MVIDSEKKEWLLRWEINDGTHKTALTRVAGNNDFLPTNSLRFSADAARIAAALSMSACNEKRLKENLLSLGYSDVLFFAYEHPQRDKIGMCIASRVKDDQLQIAAVLRGTSGEEWYSNFDIGYTAEHSGFAKAADFAELKIGDHVFTHAIGMEPSFFITGYSRGGAVANILAKRLCDRYGLERVCAYTFAAPSTTISRRVGSYRSIYNLVRQEDFFTRVPPQSWGYTKYGKTISLSGAGDISERFRQFTGEEYIGFTRQGAVDNFLCAMHRLAPNVNAYYRRRRKVGERQLSLYGFLTAVADMLSSHLDEDVADVFFSAAVSDYADLISFLSSGADLCDILSTASGAPKCSVTDSHSAAAYMAALELFLQQ